MPKPPKKSSATKATQKKKAGKKAGKDGEVATGGPSKSSLKGLTKAEKKALKNGPKVYIPPPKPPAPALPDPLDAQGLARTLPAELVVLLRRLGKKDATTRRKGLDEFKAEWVDAAAGSSAEDADAEGKVAVLIEALPVWIHHLPSLLLSSSHRSLALAVHNKLLSIPAIRSAVTDGLNLGFFTAPHQIRDVLGTWLASALEEGRRGAGTIGIEGLNLWRDMADWSPSEQVASGKIDMRSQLELLVEYLSLAILEPQQLHEEIHPPQVQADASGASTPKRGAKGPAPLPSFPSLPSKGEEDDRESTQTEEIVLPYRAAGLAGLDYVLQELPLDMEIGDNLASLLLKMELWSFLSPEATPASNGPIRRGLYSLLRTLIRRREQWTEQNVMPVAAPKLMRSVWRESDPTVWSGGVLSETLALWLTKFRHAWTLPVDQQDQEEAGDDNADDEDDDSDDSDDEEDDGEPAAGLSNGVGVEPAPSTGTVGQESYDAFLGFLQRGCNGQAVEAYPTILVILSTIPPEILPLEREALQRLFTSFWAPAEAKLLAHHGQGATPSPFMAFTSAIVDCVVYLAAKAWKSAEPDPTRTASLQEETSGLVEQEFGKVWEDGVLLPASRARGRGGLTEAENEATAVAKGLLRLHAVSSDLTSGAFKAIERSSADAKHATLSSTGKQASRNHLMNILTALSREEDTAGPLSELAVRVTVAVAESCIEATRAATGRGQVDAQVALLASALAVRGEDLRSSDSAARTVEAFFSTDIAKTLEVANPDVFGDLYAAYLAWSPDAQSAGRTYASIMRGVMAIPSLPTRFATATSVVGKTIGSQADTQQAKEEIDDLAMQAAESLEGSAAAFLRLCLRSPSTLSRDAVTGVLALLAGALAQAVSDLAATGTEAATSSDRRAAELVETLGSASQVSLTDLATSDVYGQIFGSVFDMAFVLSEASEVASSSTTVARTYWKAASKDLSPQNCLVLRSAVTRRLAGLVLDVESTQSPSSLLFVADRYAEHAIHDSGARLAMISEVLPSAVWFADHLEKQIAGTSAPTALAVVDSLVPQQADESAHQAIGQYDDYGRSSIARAAEALVAWASMSRASHNDLTPHVAFLAIVGVLTDDEAKISGGSRGLYRKDIAAQYLVAVRSEVEQLLSYWAVRSAGQLPADWFATAASGLLGKGQQSNATLVVLQSLVTRQYGHDSCRAFRVVLASLLRAADPDVSVLDRWMGLAQSIYQSRTDLAVAVIEVLSELRYESPRLQRFRNEVASSLSGISVKDISTKGVILLRTLNSIAPSAESTSEFLPQQRAVFLMKTMNGWLTAEDAPEDLPEELESRVAELYQHLCPIVQDIPGAHWESIFDLVSNNLEGSSLSDDSARSLQYFTLGLLTRIAELAATNKSLRAEWKERSSHYKLALELILDQGTTPAGDRDLPRALVEDMSVALIGSAEKTPVTTEMRPKLYSLLSQSGLQIQRLAYALLAQVITEDIPRLVVEVETSTTDLDEMHSLPRLPTELISLIRDDAAASSEVAHRGSLFGWMLVFQHFEQASATLRASFIDQLRSDHLLTDNFVPLVLRTLDISSTSQKPVEFSRFAIDEFHVATLEDMDEETEQALVAHLFYRALVNVPLLIRNWYEACKDRQLSLAFSAAVTKHFSPVLIGHEFSLLRDPSALQQLEDENLTVKVSSGAAEITASYMIDEQPMEIGVRLPPEFPLKSVEVKDLKRVGVPENKWRGWLLNVQQTITSRNGLILEALTLFKKNVALHFEGVVECAICYSIISMSDKTLPSKPCRTCKNRFHASCLYKWFNSSNSSTCPMCRSLF